MIQGRGWPKELFQETCEKQIKDSKFAKLV